MNFQLDNVPFHSITFNFGLIQVGLRLLFDILHVKFQISVEPLIEDHGYLNNLSLIFQIHMSWANDSTVLKMTNEVAKIDQLNEGNEVNTDNSSRI